ncbi:MAG: hypothetical protein WCL27_04040, partial [Betaproteobacteria bacterium]
NLMEVEALRSASFEALALYFLYKEKADFKTGILGKFFKQKLTYAFFAREMCRASSQGKPEKKFDTKDVQRLTEQLESLELVEEVRFDDGRLTMKLPFSPIWKGNPADTETAKTDRKLPRTGKGAEASESSAGLSQADSPVPLSLLTSKRGSEPFFNSVNTNSGGPNAAATLSKQAAAVATSEQAYEARSLEEKFEALVAINGGLLSHTDFSREFYAAWVRAGVTEVQLLWALFDCQEARTPFKPGDIHKILFPSEAQAQAAEREQQQRQRRGGVAL